MNARQKSQIEKLAAELDIGSRAADGIKHVLGKMPINMSDTRAASVIESLQDELDAKEESELDSDDIDVWAAAYTRKMRSEAADCDR